MRRLAFVLGAAAISTWLALPCFAVKPETWKHEQPKDFLAGTLDNVVVSSQGEVMLGREVKTLHKLDDAEVINAIVRAGDGKLYAASGPAGRIYQIDDDKVVEFAKLPDGGTVLSLLFTADGRLLAGTGGGEQARIYRIDGSGKAEVFYEPKDAKYVWSMARGPAGEIYAATGIEGELHVVDAEGKNGKVIADVKPKSILCLAIGNDGLLYAGTDEDGLIYRVNPADGKAFVLYDAKEAEISALVLDADGNIYASTAAADNAKPGRAVADKPGGTPDREDSKAGESKTPDTQSGDSKEPTPSENAEDQGEEAEGSPEPAATQPATSISRSSLGRQVQTGAEGGGNAIYRIDSNGFVTEVFREPVMILCMAEVDGVIYAGSGNEGRVYSITPKDDRVTVLAKLESAQITSLLRLSDGQIVIGTANAATLARMSERRANKGTLLSKSLDAGQVVKWGRIKWDATVPEGTKLTVATRSSNVEDEESNAWDEWSAELDASSPQQIASSAARFLQYRLTFGATDPQATPVLRSISIPRIQENRAPEISSLEVVPARDEAQKPTASTMVKAIVGAAGFGAPAATGPDDYWVIKWKAEDQNKDTLIYEVYYRAVGASRWVQMGKEIKEPLKIWDTRTVEDGTYQVRVVAKDSPSNPPAAEMTSARISDPLVVDNTPPDIQIDRVEPQASQSVSVHADLSDALHSITEVSYTVDSDDEWITLSADDDIFDSKTEAVTFTVKDLAPGEHRIALRVRDERGNTRYASRSVTISTRTAAANK